MVSNWCANRTAVSSARIGIGIGVGDGFLTSDEVCSHRHRGVATWVCFCSPCRRSAASGRSTAARACGLRAGPSADFHLDGFYIGANSGYGWSYWSDPFGDNINGKGALAGGQLGFNYQIGQFVVGLDADLDWTGMTGNISAAAVGPFGGVISATATDANNFLSTFGARAGFAIDHALIYAKGGGAWTRDVLTISVTNVGGAIASGSSTTSRIGWMVGGGLEYAVTNNITLKAEYDYVNFGTANETITIAGGGLAPTTGTVAAKLYENVAKVGISYLFRPF
jgi:outer membrane immunogenic protein